MSVNEKHMAAARDLFEDPHFRPFRNDHCIREVARELAAAEREGMKRAAGVANEVAEHLIELGNDLKDSGDDQGYRLAINEARIATCIVNTILSQASEP